MFTLSVAINCSITIFFAFYCISVEGWKLLYVIGLIEALIFCGLGWLLSGFTVRFWNVLLFNNRSVVSHTYVCIRMDQLCFLKLYRVHKGTVLVLSEKTTTCISLIGDHILLVWPYGSKIEHFHPTIAVVRRHEPNHQRDVQLQALQLSQERQR